MKKVWIKYPFIKHQKFYLGEGRKFDKELRVLIKVSL